MSSVYFSVKRTINPSVSSSRRSFRALSDKLKKDEAIQKMKPFSGGFDRISHLIISNPIYRWCVSRTCIVNTRIRAVETYFSMITSVSLDQMQPYHPLESSNYPKWCVSSWSKHEWGRKGTFPCSLYSCKHCELGDAVLSRITDARVAYQFFTIHSTWYLTLVVVWTPSSLKIP